MSSPKRRFNLVFKLISQSVYVLFVNDKKTVISVRKNESFYNANKTWWVVYEKNRAKFSSQIKEECFEFVKRLYISKVADELLV